FPARRPDPRRLPPLPTRRSSDLPRENLVLATRAPPDVLVATPVAAGGLELVSKQGTRSPRFGARLVLAKALGSGPCLVREQRRGDRKSTRLNSSHQIMSYAVFGL